MGQPRQLIVYIQSFQTQISQKNLLQRDSNLDHHRRRRARLLLDHHHCPKTKYRTLTKEAQFFRLIGRNDFYYFVYLLPTSVFKPGPRFFGSSTTATYLLRSESI